MAEGLDHETGREDYTKDGSVDLKGNPVRRSKSGGWTACSFIVVYEVFERMAYFGISVNLVFYLTNKIHMGTVTSSNNVTNWVGTVWMTPILGAYVADTYLGRYWTFIIGSIIYLLGMCLLTLAVSLPSLKPPACKDPSLLANCEKASPLQLGIFFFALYVLALGTGGTKPNISTIGADQFDEFDPKEKSHKISFFNWWMFSIVIGSLFAKIVLVYIEDNVGWTVGYMLPTMGLAVSIAIFVIGTPFYRHKLPMGSPFTRMARVLVAAVRKRRVPLPSDPKDLHELDVEVYGKKGKFRINSTPSLRLLNKAAVRSGSTSPWMLCTVTQVEETKQMLRMIPILFATFVPSTMLAQVNTLFVKQAATLDGQMGTHFKIPPASLAAFTTLTLLISIVLYDRVFVRTVRHWTKNPRGITILQRMGIGCVLHILIMVTASLTERRRLHVARDSGAVQNGGQVPLTIFVLLPQFVLVGIADAFLEVGKIEFFYDQAPESMKSLGSSFSSTSNGVGNFLSSIILSSAVRITGRNDHKGWILNNLNASHLDYYFAFFVILNVLNFIFFLIVSKFYEYRAETMESADVLGDDRAMVTLDGHKYEELATGST